MKENNRHVCVSNRECTREGILKKQEKKERNRKYKGVK